MKKLVCLMIFAAMFTVSAEAAPEKPSAAPKAAAKATKQIVKKNETPAKTTSMTAGEPRKDNFFIPQNATKTPLYLWSQDSKVK